MQTLQSMRVIGEMESHSETSEKIQVEITESEHFLLGPGDEAVSIMSFTQRTRVMNGDSRGLQCLERAGAMKWRRHSERPTLRKRTA